MSGYPKNPPVHEGGHAVVAHYLHARGKVRARVSHRGPGDRWYGGDCQYERTRRELLEGLGQEWATDEDGTDG